MNPLLGIHRRQDLQPPSAGRFSAGPTERLAPSGADALPGAHPLLDLRRGDADENRSSPYGRGWRVLAMSAALDFNYLTAAVVFVWLIVAPAALVGAAIALSMTLARWKLDALSHIALTPVAVVTSLALLAAVAFWIARPLVPLWLDSFRHLHHTLVFPAFAAFREALAAGLEQLPPDTLDAEGLHRRRRAGTVIAAGLLAAAGLIVVAAFALSTGAGLVGASSVIPRGLIGAFLGNAMVVLGVSTMVASVVWCWREMATDEAVRDWTPAQAPSPSARAVSQGTGTMRVAHLSDLHLVGEPYGYRMESGRRGPCGNARVAEALERLEAIHSAQPFAWMVMTGDVTDAGTRAEWIEFLRLVHRRPGLRDRLVFVPGNHDVNVIDRTNPGRLDLPWSLGGALRKLRVVLALDAVQGHVVRVVDCRSRTLGPTLEEYLRTGNRPARLRELAECGTWRGRRAVVEAWDEIFPLVVPPAGDRCGLVLLDSNARRHFSLTNAIGFVGAAQLRALDALLGAGRGAPWIVAVHHHVVEFPIRRLGLKERAGVVLANAPDLLRVVARHDTPVLVLYGHRHRHWLGSRGNAVLCSAASVTLGDKGTNDGRGRFSVYDVAFEGETRMRLAAVERVTVG